MVPDDAVEASSVYLIVRDCSLFPRSERIPWFFKHLLYNAPLQVNNEECTVVTVSVQGKDGQFHNLLQNKEHYDLVQTNFPSFLITSPENQQIQPPPFYITPTTQLVLVSYKYRMVFSIDVTPSMAAIDPVTGEVLFDQVLATLEKCLISLVDSHVAFPGVDVHVQPQIYISVVAQGFLAETLRVLIQGVLLERRTIPAVMSTLKTKLRAFESQIATIYSAGMGSQVPLYKRAVSELASCVHKSVFALKLLPPDACPSLIRDGVTSAPDLTSYDNMTMLLNREDITCSSILVGSGPHLHCAFGYTPDTEILRHLSTSTCGAYIERSYLPSGSSLQELLLFKKFSPTPLEDAQVHPFVSTLVMDGEAVVSDMGALHAMMAVDYPFPWTGPPPMVPLLQTQHKAYTLECDLPRIVDVRVREGFVVTSVTVDDTSAGTERILAIRLVLSWVPNIKIAYSIRVLIGAHGPSSVLKIELLVLAYYEFLHQFMKNEKGAQSPAAMSVSKLQSFLSNINETDLVLSYLYTQCQTPLTPSPALVSTPPNLQAQYKAFWKTMSGLRNHSWHRWLKTEKIGVILSPLISVLDPDQFTLSQFPLPRPRAVYPAHFLFEPPTAILMDYLTRWATFNQSKQLFVKFLEPPPGVTSSLLPSPSFCVIRISYETSGFLIMQLAFFSTSPATRADTIASIKQELCALTYPNTTAGRNAINANPGSTLRAIAVGPPVIPISRSIRTMLVRYDPVPVHSPHGPSQPPPHHSPARLVFNPSATPLPSFSPLLAWYMWRHRWVWALPDASIAEQMLGILIECRLKEGFTLVNVAYGIYTFIKEFTLHAPHSTAFTLQSRITLPCTLQYVVFVANPHTLTTELWMEPQHGRYVHARGESTEAELFSDLRAWLEVVDTKVISALSTLYLLDSADIHEKKLDLSSYPRAQGPVATPQSLSVFAIVHPSAIAFPARRLDVLSHFATEKIDQSYPLLSDSVDKRNQNATVPLNGKPTANGHSNANGTGVRTDSETLASGDDTSRQSALLDAANDKLYSMVAECMAWLSDYEVFPDKSCDDLFKRGRNFVKIIHTHPRSPNLTYASSLLTARLVLAHLQPVVRSPDSPKSIEVSYYLLSADAFKCPQAPTSSATERLSTLFQQKDVQILSAEQDEERDPEEGVADTSQDENHVAQAIVAEYLAQIQQAYRRCFTKAVYSHLRAGGVVSSQDFSSCLEVMHSAHLDIDLSEFLHIISSSKDFSRTTVHDQFAAELAHSFSKVPLPNTPYFFYHRTSLGEAAQTNSYEYDEDDSYGYDKKADIEFDQPHPDIHATSSLELCPLFLGETEGDIDSKDTLGIYSLPLLLQMEVVDEGNAEVVTTIPTSDSGPTTLRFVCLVLPPLLGPAKLVHESICTVLHKHKKRIVALLSAKILAALLSMRPLPDPMLNVVMRHLQSLSPSSPSATLKSSSRYVQCQTFELNFVDRREGNILFVNELENSKPSSATSASNPTLTRLSGDLYVLRTKPVTSDDELRLSDEPLTYWLLLKCTTDAVYATLYSTELSSEANLETTEPLTECDVIWKGVRDGIVALSRRVNQTILLQRLHDNRYCSDLLLPAEPSLSQSSRSIMAKEDQGEGKTKFRPGEFECPLVHTITLPLHDRTEPRIARSHLLTVLHSFEVANRSNVFVYHQANGKIFYICLRVASQQPPPAPQASDQPPYTSPPPSPSLPVHGLGQQTISLNIYGIDPADVEITQSLHQHLENKLSSHTLGNLSALFMRNPLLKLTTEDLDFLRSSSSIQSATASRPPQAIAIQIPAFVADSYLFLHFFKQNLLQFLQATHLSQAAQQREDTGVTSEPNPTHERIDLRPSDFLLMYNHIPSPTSVPPYTTIGQGMACISISLLDKLDACMTATARSTGNAQTEWTREDLCATLLPEVPQPSIASTVSTWSNRVLLRIWGRGLLNIQALTNQLLLCANQTLHEYVLETSLLQPGASVSLENLPTFVGNFASLLSLAKSLSTPSVYEHTQTVSLPSWMTSTFLADLRDAIADSNSIVGLHVFACQKDHDGTFHCSPCVVGSSSRNEHGTDNAGGCDCEDVDCAYASATSDFYNYCEEPNLEPANKGLDLASTMMTNRARGASFFILGGKRVEAAPPTKQSADHPPALYYPPIKDSQLPEPLVRQCAVAVRLDAPHLYEQGYKVTIYTYNWDQSKLDSFKDRYSRLTGLCNLRQQVVGTIVQHKMGLFQHLPSTQPPKQLSWDSIESVVAPQPITRRRTTSAAGNQEDKKPADMDHKKMRLEPQRTKGPAFEFDSVFRDNYPPAALPPLYSSGQVKDPVFQLANQSKALAQYIEHRAALRTAAMGSISILPSPSSAPPKPLTSYQLDSVITISRLIHFRCVPFLFGDQLQEFGPTKPALPILDAFVRDYVEYLKSYGVVPILVESATSTPTKRVSTRAYLQKVFLDGTLLVKISFREASVACELFAVPQLDTPTQPPQFPSPTTRNFGEELTQFTRILHLNSFTYDFHVSQLYHMIKFPHTPTPAQSPTQSICSILQALHQYYPTPPIHASTCLDSFSSSCPVQHLSPEIPEITTNQLIEFMMLGQGRVSDSIVPLHHIGVYPAILLQSTLSPLYSEMCTVVFAKESLPVTHDECGCGTEDSPTATPATQESSNALAMHVFVVKIGEVCSTDRQRTHSSPPSDNTQVIEQLHAATATSSINFQRNQLWNKLQHGNPYSPALTHSEFQILTRLILSRPATQLDPTLILPVNLLKLGSSVWHQLLAQLRTVGGERVRQVFADPIHHLLIFHPTNNSQLVHFVWNEAEKEANILLCRLDKDCVGSAESDNDEVMHLSQLVTLICHFIWRLFLVKQPF